MCGSISFNGLVQGTDIGNIPSIMEAGLKVGGVDVAVAVGQAHGQGVRAFHALLNLESPVT